MKNIQESKKDIYQAHKDRKCSKLNSKYLYLDDGIIFVEFYIDKEYRNTMQRIWI